MSERPAVQRVGQRRFEVRNERMALVVADLHGLPTVTVRPIVGAGWTNHVVVLGSTEPQYVVRYAVEPADDLRITVEAWVLPRVAALGVPAPRLVAAGELDGIPYLVEDFVPGVGGQQYASAALWRTLGRYAAALQAVPLGPDAPDVLFGRFGRDLPTAWRRHLDYNLEQLTGDDPLLGLGVYEPEQQPALRAVVARLMDVPLTHGLGHGDLTLANVLVPRTGPPVLVDWGSAAAGPSPWSDVVLLRRHQGRDGVPDGYLDAFLNGCGFHPSQVAGTLADLELLAALDLVRWAREQAPRRLAGLVAAARKTVLRSASR